MTKNEKVILKNSVELLHAAVWNFNYVSRVWSGSHAHAADVPDLREIVWRIERELKAEPTSD